MENRIIQQSREHEKEIRAQYQRMSGEQGQQELLTRRENYNRARKKGNKWKHLLIVLFQECHSKIQQRYSSKMENYKVKVESLQKI
jgi:hypothetical protein